MTIDERDWGLFSACLGPNLERCEEIETIPLSVEKDSFNALGRRTLDLGFCWLVFLEFQVVKGDTGLEKVLSYVYNTNGLPERRSQARMPSIFPRQDELRKAQACQ